MDSKASEIALPGQRKSTSKFCSVCRSKFTRSGTIPSCCRDCAYRAWLAGRRLESQVTDTAVLERLIDHFVAKGAGHAYVQWRLRTVEKNPGPAEKPFEKDTNPDMSVRIVDVLVQWLELFGFDSTGFSTLGDVRQWREWLKESSGDWMKLCKFKLAAFYQYAQRDLLEDKQLPPCPFPLTRQHPLHLLGGRAGRFMRRMIRPTNPARQEFLSSLLLVKTGMPRPGKEELLKAAKKTLEALTTPRRIFVNRIPETVPEGRGRLHGLLSHSELVEQVRRTAREIFARATFKTSDLLARPIVPTFSANYVRSRREFGTFGELLDTGLLDTLPIRDLYLRSFHEEEEISSGRRLHLELSGFDGMRDQFLRTYFDALKIAMKEEPIASAVPLAEALKVRVITKGPPFTQFVLKPLQEFMWRQLKNHPAFELIGDPVDASKLLPRLGYLMPGEALLSGDYSDATNQMDPALSEAAWETVCDVCAVPRALKELGFRVLTGHWLEIDKQGTLMPQAWGQLMGSIISFPILCIINATVCRLALEHDQNRSLSLSRCRLMVNGDDCLFPIGPHGKNAWELFGKMAGLSPSVGKVYYSKSFCNINSTTFEYLPDTSEPYRRVAVIRLGLCFGLKRSIADKENDDDYLEYRLLGNGVEWDSSLGAQHRALLFECPESCKERVHRKFLSRNRKVLEAAREYQMPWYIPECYGGVGLQPFGVHGPDLQDRLIVTAMIHSTTWTDEFCPQPLQWKGPTKTKIRQIAVDALKSALPNLPQHWVTQGSGERDGLDSPSLSTWVLYQRPYDVLSIEDDFRIALDALHKLRKVRYWYLQRMNRFAWMTPTVVVPRRLVTEVDIRERLPNVLPTRQETAWRDVDNLLVADPEVAQVKWSL